MDNNQTGDRTLNGVRIIQQALDEQVSKLRTKFHETNNKSLFWNLYVWFPLLQLASFFNLMKQAKGLDVKSLMGFLTTGTFLGISISNFFGVTFVVSLLKDLHLDNVNWSVVGIILFIIWYLTALKKLEKEVVNVESKYFLYPAYRKFDNSYKIFGPLIESSSDIPDNLLETAAQQLEEYNGGASTWQEKYMEAQDSIATLQQKFREFVESAQQRNAIRDAELQVKRDTELMLAGMNSRLLEVIVEHQDVHYKHLDFLGTPFIVYKKERNVLVHQWSRGVIPYEKRIGLAKKNNFFVRVQENQGLYVNDKNEKFMGLCVDVKNKKYVVAYEQNHISNIHNIINSDEMVATVQAIIAQIK
ncbi:hypothetical protein CN918_28285 [Priestia megaterium]|nr:hypothetical protein CN918_28285 [Priestia megaterium]